MKIWLLILSLLATPATATDGVATSGKLSDTDFHALATCGAAKGKTCQGPSVRWPQARVTVAMHGNAGGMPPALSARVSQAFDAAIAAINGGGAGITLVRNDSYRHPNIILRRVNLREGDLTKAIPNVPDYEAIGVGYSTVWWQNNRDLTKATILISAYIQPRDVASVVLEELFQSLGFRYDVEGRYYQTRSILAQDSNATTRIKDQDAAILRLHYPPPNN